MSQKNKAFEPEKSFNKNNSIIESKQTANNNLNGMLTSIKVFKIINSDFNRIYKLFIKNKIT